MDTIFYTHALDTHSSAVRTLYFDEDTGNVWLVFPNGTVVNRHLSHLTLPILDAMLERNGDSLGKLWNNAIKYWEGDEDNTDVENVSFVKRADVTVNTDPTDVVSVPKDEDVAAEATDVEEGGHVVDNMTVLIDVHGLGLHDLWMVENALLEAGIKSTLRCASAW